MKLSNFIANLLLLTVFLSANAFGQDPSQVNWPLWENERLNFSSGNPVESSTGNQYNQLSNTAAYSDESGQLQIYAGKEIYYNHYNYGNAPRVYSNTGNFSVFAGGQKVSIKGGDRASQVLILPHPTVQNEYFVFSVGTYYKDICSNYPLPPTFPSVHNSPSGSYYSRIKSNGTVVALDVPLLANNPSRNYTVAEEHQGYRAMGAIQAIPYCQNGGGYWIFVMGTDSKLAIFNLRANGSITLGQEVDLNTTLGGDVDYISSVPLNPSFPPSCQGVSLYAITVSPQGDKVAISSFGPYNSNKVNIFNFQSGSLTFNRSFTPYYINSSTHYHPMLGTSNDERAFTSSGRYFYYSLSSDINDGTTKKGGIWRINLDIPNNVTPELVYDPEEKIFDGGITTTFMQDLILGVDGNIYGLYQNDSLRSCNSSPYIKPTVNVFRINNPESNSVSSILVEKTNSLACKYLFESIVVIPTLLNAPAPNRPINSNFDILCPNGDCETTCGSDVTYRLSAFSGAYDYVWKVDGVVVANNVSHYTHSWSGIGTHQVEVTVTSSCSNDVVVKQIDVEVQSVSSFDVYPREICPNAKDNLIPLSGGYPLGGTYSGVGVTNNILELNTLPAGDYIITYTPPAGIACTSVLTDTITLSEIATFEITNDRVEVGSTTPVDLSVYAFPSLPRNSREFISYDIDFSQSGVGGLGPAFDINTGVLYPAILPLGNYIITYKLQYDIDDHFDVPTGLHGLSENFCFDMISDTIKIVPVGMGKVKATTNKQKIVELTASPNPFNSSTTIRFSSEVSSEKYTMLVRNSLGQEIKRIEGVAKKGNNEVEINMLGYSSGLYYVEYISSDRRENIKIVLAR
ncbi:T9SS type A sorting domain-containing protein [Bernardetia sp. OM2101]|uniref:T9SS type A sorting domain-containing protein n=1 Tax=Bernardetia sp. OM2101 TaxID=3344876 RepID=UPI0035CF1E97